MGPWSICLSKTPSNFNLVSLGAPAQSFLGAYALARLPLKHQFGFSWSSGPEFPWSICLGKTPSNINLVSLGAPAQSFLGASALARLPLTLTWISLGAPAQSFPLLGAFCPSNTPFNFN